MAHAYPVARVFTAAQMQEADRQASAAGIPLLELMTAAGRALAAEAVRAFPQVRSWHVLVGPGNNGGDGWVAALELLRRGVPTCVWELNAARAPAQPAAEVRAAWLREAPARQLSTTELIPVASVPGAGIIDALFGSGLSRPLDGQIAELAAALSTAGSKVVAADVPSGLNPDLAVSPGPHFRADLTVALAGLKPAHLFEPARSACGVIRVADIGFPEDLLAGCSDTELLTPGVIRQARTPANPAGHKYDAGAVCVVAGSDRYRGAAELAIRAAWRSGAGLVTLVSDGAHSASWPETIFMRHEAGTDWPPASLDRRLAAACLIGPGLERSALQALPAMLSWAPGPVVLDATALHPLVLEPALAEIARRPVVLTPHAGEAERLLERFVPSAAGTAVRDPLAAAAALAERLHATVVLKGPATVIAGAGGELAVSARGHPGLATAGSGDVLAGMITALLARPGSGSLQQRVCAAVVAHGLAGELAAGQYGESLVASDVIGSLPQVFLRYG